MYLVHQSMTNALNQLQTSLKKSSALQCVVAFKVSDGDGIGDDINPHHRTYVHVKVENVRTDRTLHFYFT